MSGNRHDRRAQAAKDRVGVAVSPALLQKVLAEREEEIARYRRLLFGVLRQLGRVRVRKVFVEMLAQGDTLDIREDLDEIIIEYKAGEPDPDSAPKAG